MSLEQIITDVIADTADNIYWYAPNDTPPKLPCLLITMASYSVKEIPANTLYYRCQVQFDVLSKNINDCIEILNEIEAVLDGVSTDEIIYSGMIQTPIPTPVQMSDSTGLPILRKTQRYAINIRAEA